MRRRQSVGVVVSAIALNVVWQRHHIQELLAVLVEEVGGELIARQGSAAVILAAIRGVVNHEAGVVVTDGLRKVAGPFQGRGDREIPVAATALGVLMFFRCEKEELVLVHVPVFGDENRAAQRETVGVVAVRAFADGRVGGRAVGVPAARIQALVADEHIGRTMEFLGAAFSGYRDGGAAGVAYRRP